VTRLTSADDLARAGLVAAEALPGLRAVAERYAVAVTTAVAQHQLRYTKQERDRSRETRKEGR